MILKYPNKPKELYPESLPDLDDGKSFADQKLDGWRSFITKDTTKSLPWTNGNEISFVSRRDQDKGGPVHLDVSPQIREVIESLNLPDQTMLDGEWLSRRTKDLDIPECLYVFDILWLDNKWMGNDTCWSRRLKLMELLQPSDFVRIPKFVESGFFQFFNMQKKIPWTEGVVVKEKDSFISASRQGCKKTALWIKVKWRSGHDGQTIVA